MNPHANILGFHQPGNGWLYRVGVGWKYLLLLLLSITPMVVGRWWLTLVMVAVVLVLLASSGIGPRRALRLGWMMWFVLAVIAVVHLLSGTYEGAVVYPGNILVAVLTARMLTLTTSTPEITDALATALTPLARLGVRTERFALAVALMVRSIPFLMGAVDDARDAARARGLERKPHRLLVPVVLGSVAYAQRTAEALHARGVGERH